MSEPAASSSSSASVPPEDPQAPRVMVVRFSLDERSCMTQRIMAASAMRGDGSAVARAWRWCRMCRWSEHAERN